MNNEEKYKKEIKKTKIIKYISLTIIPISFILIGITAPKNNTIATILAIILITAIILFIVKKRKLEEIKEDYRHMKRIKHAIEDEKDN